MPLDELPGFFAIEDPGSGADGSDATRPDGTGELQAVDLGKPFDQAGDVTGIERVAPSGAVNVVDRIGPEVGLEGVGNHDRAALAHGDDNPLRAEVVKRSGLTDGVGFAEDQGGLVGIGQEDVGERQDRLEMPKVIARAWRGDVQDGPRAVGLGPGKTIGERFGVETGKDQETAEVDDLGVGRQRPVEVVDRQSLVRAKRVDEPAILAFHVDNQALAGGPDGVNAQLLGVDAIRFECFGDITPEEVIPHSPADGRPDTKLAQDHRRVRGAAADVENQLIRLDELSRAREMRDRRTEVIGHDHPSADDRGFIVIVTQD